MATIKDVAQAAQVSAAAVSRVLNKDDNISVTPEVRARIFQAALTLSAGALAKVTTELVISQMSEIGSLLIVGIALNLLGITKIKVANLILSPFLPVLFYLGALLFTR